jgi:hypothetical protein
VLLLTLLALSNMTAEGPAERALGQSVAILTDIDTYLDEHYGALHEDAQEAGAASLELPDFPITITVAGIEVTERSREEFRALVLARAAVRLRDEGTSAFRDASSDAEVDPTSPEGAVDAGLDLLRATPHNVFASLTFATAAIAVLLTAALALSTSGTTRHYWIGLTVFSAAALFLIVAVALRFMLRVAADGTDDEMTREFLKLAQEMDWASIRNGIIMSAGTALALVASVALDRWRAAEA